jgi:hypothetical protein
MSMAARDNVVDGICKHLTDREVITPKRAQELRNLFKSSSIENFTDFLLEEGLIERNDILRAVSEHYQIPSFDVDGYFFDHALLNQLPKGMMLRHEIIPLRVDNDILIVIAADPSKQDELLEEIGKYVSYDVQFFVGISRDICDAVKEFHDEPVNEVSPDEEPLD